MILTLPYPPTANTYYRHIVDRGRPRTLISKRGRDYRRTVAILARGCGMIRGRLDVHIQLWPPDRRKRDLDNAFKGLLDSLEHAGVIENDENIDHLEITRMEVSPPGRVVVHIEVMKNQEEKDGKVDEGKRGLGT